MDDEGLSREELAARLDAQERAREVLAATAVPAPDGLRARVAALRPPAPTSAPVPERRHGPSLLVGSIALVALVIALVLVVAFLPGGALAPTVAEAAELAARPAVDPAPAPRADAPALLDAEVDGVAFPAWAAGFGWEATGARSDELDEREATTVFYENDGRRLAYTIVSGAPLAVRGGGTESIAGTDFTAIEDGVTWERDGHTCVLTGEGVPDARLLELAGWRGDGAVVF